MPRVYSSVSDPIDFCRIHFPTEEQAWEKYGNVGDGPDDRGNCFGWDAEHPDYEDSGYRCEICNRRLTSRDNEPLQKKGAVKTVTLRREISLTFMDGLQETLELSSESPSNFVADDVLNVRGRYWPNDEFTWFYFPLQNVRRYQTRTTDESSVNR